MKLNILVIQELIKVYLIAHHFYLLLDLDNQFYNQHEEANKLYPRGNLQELDNQVQQ